MIRSCLVAIASAVLLFGPAGAAAAVPPSGSAAAIVTADPLRLGLTLSASRTKVGTAVKAKGSATNLGATSFTTVVITIRVPAGVSAAGSASHDLGRLAAGATASTAWSLCATVAGNYVVMVSGTARDALGRTWTATSAAALLIVVAGTKRCK